jgi:hypothetical protein
MDVKTTFLNKMLEVDIYMVQPHNLEDQEKPHKVCKRFSMEAFKRWLLPSRHSIHLSKSIFPMMDNKRRSMVAITYASAIRSLMYSMLCTRLDIAYAVSVTSWLQVNLSREHWNVIKCIHKYLRRTKDMAW